jgi:hypothetical protein
MFTTDRDLLALEPALFRDATWTAQRLLTGTGDVTATTLTLTAQDNDFESAGVDAGAVVLIDGVPYEVIERTSATVVSISRLRDAASDPVRPASPATGVPVSVFTFGPQRATVHQRLLLMLGLGAGSSLGAGAIKNADDFRFVEALGALHLIYAAASAMSAPGSPLVERAESYRRRFALERRLVGAQIDTNGDGAPDATRRLNVLLLQRA